MSSLNIMAGVKSKWNHFKLKILEAKTFTEEILGSILSSLDKCLKVSFDKQMSRTPINSLNSRLYQLS